MAYDGVGVADGSRGMGGLGVGKGPGGSGEGVSIEEQIRQIHQKAKQ